MMNYKSKTMGGSTSSIRQGQDSEKLEEGAGLLHENDMAQPASEIGATHSGGSSDEMTNSTTSRYETKVTDLDLDSLVICASNLALRDLTNMAMTCQRFRDAAYSDAVWEIQCRVRWPPKQLCHGQTFQYCGGRDAYVARHTATQQLRYTDPMDVHLHLLPMPVNHLLLDDATVTIAQGPIITVWKVNPSEEGHLEAPNVSQALRDHNARVTCMRLIPVGLLGAMRNFLVGVSNILVTSSCDHTIRLWGKGRSLRTLRGHQGPVNTLADQLVGKEGSPPVLASGGTDGTVRIWSLSSSSSSSRGRSPLLATLHGLESSIKELAVAGHNPSLLISAAKDAKLRVWDVMATPSTAGVGTCVGTTKGTFDGMPVGLKSVGPICYIGTGTTVKAVDLRTMCTVATVSAHEHSVLTFAVSPSGTNICTGGSDKTAKLWDLRMIGDSPEPWAVLGNHTGPVQSLHYDSYKVITGGTADRHVHVWSAETGDEISSLDSTISSSSNDTGVSAFVASGGRLVTGTCGEDPGFVRLQDFTNCVNPLVDDSNDSSFGNSSSKFWDNTPEDA
ncbi:hypothetical protein M758_10G176600 [Ceratodon purpureus]|nr:hypothetical protein M758_10G176600 [Ceratodon purpureus]